MNEELSKATQVLYDKFIKDINEPLRQHKTFDYKELSSSLISDVDALIDRVIKERNEIIRSLGTFYLIQNIGLSETHYYIKIQGWPKVQIEDYAFNLLSPFAYLIIQSSYGNKFVENNKNNQYAYTLRGDEYEEGIK